jgi:hypothetical protein
MEKQYLPIIEKIVEVYIRTFSDKNLKFPNEISEEELRKQISMHSSWLSEGGRKELYKKLSNDILAKKENRFMLFLLWLLSPDLSPAILPNQSEMRSFEVSSYPELLTITYLVYDE